VVTRFAAAGHDVVLGSREQSRAQATVDALQARWGDRLGQLTAGANASAAAQDLVVVATVWDAAFPTTRYLASYLEDKVVVSIANALERDGRNFRPVLPEEGSIAAAVQAAAPRARVVAALQHVPAAALRDLDADLESDVLVAGDDDDARTVVAGLIEEIPGLRALDAGALVNALGIEAFAAALLTVNLRHKGEATLRLAGTGPRR
jgi:NADPH-dependent F420 reductase